MALNYDEMNALREYLRGELSGELHQHGVALGVDVQKKGHYRLAVRTFGKEPSEEFLNKISEKAESYTQEKFGKDFDREADMDVGHSGPARAG